MLVYIAGPYTAKTPALTHVNVMKLIDVGLAVHAKGHTPFIPVLTHYVELRAAEKGIEISYEEFMQWDFDILDRCDALFFAGSSPGADRELDYWMNKFRMVYRNIDEVPDIKG